GSVPFIPEPSAVQLLPFHLATRLAALPPAVVKIPPAYKSLPDTANAFTLVPASSPPLVTPEPSADQLLPFHLPTELPAAAYTSLPDTASADTGLLIPEPSA